MINSILAFSVVGGACLLICNSLINRVTQPRRLRRESAGDSSSIGPGDSTGSDGWSLFSWSGGDSSSSCDSSSSSDFGGDSGGGGDGGGGD
jgi:hypothetical protein